MELSINRLLFLIGCFTAITLSTNGLNLVQHDISNINNFESVIQFKLNVKQIEEDAKKCVELSKFELNDVQWQMKACKTEIKDDVNVLETSLSSNIQKDNTARWSCLAKVSLKLFPKVGNETISKVIDYHNFTKENPTHKIGEIVEWKLLNANYVENEEATLEIAISTMPPNRTPQLEQTFTKFHVVVKDLKQLGDQFSKEIVVREIGWKVLTTKIDDFFAVFIYANENDMAINTAWEVSAEIKLISSDKSEPVTKKFSGIKFHWTQSNWGFSKFIKWSDLIDPNKKYVVNDATLLQVELNVGEPITHTSD